MFLVNKMSGQFILDRLKNKGNLWAKDQINHINV
jgi:hypothetical protein